MLPFLLTLILLASSVTGPAAASPAAVQGDTGTSEAIPPWGDLAVRWILLPNEERRYRGLETIEERRHYLEEVWKRRDPNPADTKNPSRQRFDQRVSEANELFSGEGRLGSMTDRGRVYLLVGPPSQISQRYQATPRFSPLTVGGNSRQKSKVLVETWSWRPEDLAPEIRQLLEERNWKIELIVEFRVSSSRYSLLEGEDLVRLSTRALVQAAER